MFGNTKEVAAIGFDGAVTDTGCGFAVMNRGITSSIVELELDFTIRFLAIMGHPA